MSTGRKTSSRTAQGKGGSDAIALLMADHKEVKRLFKEYEKLVKGEADETQKQQLAEQVCTLLTAHATIEEELFYPAARGALEEQDLLDEAEVEHAAAKDLIAQIQGMQPSEDLYDAKVAVLGEYVDHHVKEEEGELFPKLKKAELDLEKLGADLSARKHELLVELGAEEEA